MSATPDISTTNLPTSATVVDVLGNGDGGDGTAMTVRIPVDDLAAQFLADGPIREALRELPIPTETTSSVRDLVGTVDTNGDVVGSRILINDLATQLLTGGPVREALDIARAEANLAALAAVDVATIANVTLSGEQTIDGVATSASSVLVIGQTTATQNGIYTSGSSAWTRRADADAGAEISLRKVLVKSGTARGGTVWQCANDATAVVGTDALVWVQTATGILPVGSVTNDRLAAVAAGTIKGRISGGASAPPEDLTAEQVTGELGRQSTLGAYRAVGTEISGYYLSASTGAAVADTGYKYLKWPVHPGQKLRVTTSGIGGATAMAIFYSSVGGAFLSALNIGTTTQADYLDLDVTVPAGAYEIGVTGIKAQPMVLEVKDALSGQAVHDVSISGKAYTAPLYTYKSGYYGASNGVFVSDTGYRSTKFAVSAGDLLSYTGSNIGSGVAIAVFLDAAGTKIPGSQVEVGINGVVSTYTNYRFTAPSGAVWCCISGIRDGYAMPPIAKRLDVAPSLGATAEGVADYIIPEDFAITENYYLNRSSGAAVAGTGWSYAKCAVVPGEWLAYRGLISGGAVAAAIFYDAFGNRLLSADWIGPGTSGVNDFYDDPLIFRAPEGAATVGVTWASASNFRSLLIRRIDPLAGPAISLVNYWRNKRIVWAGTSIPAGSTTAQSYPSLVGRKLGAHVSNIAVGSSPARFGVAGKRSASDPYGITGLPYANVAYSLAMTTAEKQAFIANYVADYYPKLTGAPTSLDETEQAKILSCSWEAKLPSLVPTADLMVWDHGHNDWAANSKGTDAGATSGGFGDLLYLPASLPSHPDLLTGVGANADPTRDRGTFLGAMNYLIDQVYRLNYRCRHLVVGHYEQDRKANVIAGQQALVKLWNFPMIETWKASGISQQKLRNADGSVMTSAGLPVTITKKFMTDDLHPRQYPFFTTLAEIMAARIVQIR